MSFGDKMKKNKMKVQKGWKDIAGTIPHYEYINKVNIMWLSKNNIFIVHKNNQLIQHNTFWHCEFNHRAFVVNPKTVFWFKDKPIILLSEVERVKFSFR